MKAKQSTSGWPLRWSIAFAASLAMTPALLAQTSGDTQNTRAKQTQYSSSSSSSESEAPTIPRIWGGVIGSYTPLKTFTASTQTNSTSGEVVSSTVANGQAGGGLTVNARIYGSFWVNFGAVYRYGGYDTSDSINDAQGTLFIERTRARIFDFPLLVRYAGPRFRWNKHAFYEVGGAIRDASNIKVSDAAVTNNGPFCCAPPSTLTIRHIGEGAVVGTGLTGRDEFGIVVSPEIRYTRWMDDMFRSPTVATQRDQLEITISFGF